MQTIISFFVLRVFSCILALLQCLFPCLFATPGVLLEPQTGAGSAAPVYRIVEENGGTQMAEFTVLTYNVKACDLGTKITEIAGEIADTGAQVVFLQEIDCGTKRSAKTDQAKQLAAELAFSYAFFPAMKYDGGLYGTAILSAFPLSGAALTALTVPDGMEPRALGQADIAIEGASVRLFVTHLSYENAAVRAQQLREVSAALNAAPGAFLLGGDFNISSYDEYALLENTVAAHNAPTPGIWKIDNLFSSAGNAFGNVRSVPTGYSDHDLVLAEAAIAQECPYVL